MKIFLTLTDFTVPSYQVKLKFTLTGNGYTISNQSLLNLPAFTLSPGTPLEISGSDLAPYLATQNLLFSGIDVADYDQRKVLPEGPCQICVEVIDFSNPNQAVLSNPACSQVWFSLNDPPLTNTPFCGNEITTSDPQQIIFSWSPLHMNSLHSAGTQYTFELFEIRPDGADPNQVVNSSLPIFMQVTDQTFINYGITEPQLQTGMSYAWRVKAQDIQGRDFFRNNGYSTVCTFTYGNVAASLADGITLTLNSTGTGTRVGFAWWNVSSTFTGYKVEVRKTGNPDYEWFPYESLGGELKIYQLEPSTQYECRVKGLIGDDYESEWSNTSVFTTQPTPDYACGNTTIPPVENTLTPLMNAISGMTFTVGQFEMMVTDIQPLDPILKPGHYTGTGKINVAFLYDVRVSYEDILVDDNLMVRSGKVEAITQGVDAWMQSQIEPDYYVDGTITDFEWTDSTSLTVWVDGQPQTFSFDEHDPIIIQDEDGMIYTFNSDGTYSVFSTLTYSNDVLAATADYRIDFSADEDQQFGFDKKQHSEWIHDYEVIRLIDSTNYFVAYKSVAEGENDDVIANITSEITLLDVNFIADINGSETALSAEKINDTTYQVHLNGLEESCFVYARHGQLRIGKLWVKVLPEIELDVVIVPVNGATLSNINELQTNLNKIYAQANAKFNVTVAPNFQSTEWDVNADGKVQTGDVDLMSHYSEEMRLLRDTYFETDSNQNAYYLFVIPEFLDADQSGYMVRGKSVGFLKSGETSITAAHELAHGIFSLEHTFPEIEQGSTNNLMDYTSASLSVEQRTHLTQKQWYRIHEPLPAWSMFDLEEEGEYSYDNYIPFYNNQKIFTVLEVGDNLKGFILLNGGIYKFSNAQSISEVMFDRYGRVYSFKTSLGIIYEAFIGRNLAGDPVNIGYLSREDYIEYKNRFPGATSLSSEAVTFVKSRRYQFSDCPVGGQVYQKSVLYYHNNKSGGEFWIEEYGQCLIEREFANPEYKSSSNYNNTSWTGIYIGPSVGDANFTVLEGECEYNEALAELNDDGSAAQIYFCLKDDTENDASLVQLANYISSIVDGKHYAFYDDVENRYELLGLSPAGYQMNAGSVLCSALKREGIFSVEGFSQHYQKNSWFFARDVDSVISHVNIRADIPAHYNVYSIDYTSFETPHVKNWDPSDPSQLFEVLDYIEELFYSQLETYPEIVNDVNYVKLVEFVEGARENPTTWLENKLLLRMNIVNSFDLLGVYDRYEYSLADLVSREKEGFKNVVLEKENNGQAIPINYADEYDQYYNKYDTDCAFFLGFEYLKMYAETVFEPVVLSMAISRFQHLTARYKTFKIQHGNVDDVLKNNGSVDGVTRTLDEIAPNGFIPHNSQTDNQFHKWFDDLTLEELDLVLANPSLKTTLEARIRYPGGFHEWCMVCEIRTFKSWKVSMAEIHRFRTRTLDLTGVNPTTGEVFVHGGHGSTAFHKELRSIIQTSNSLEDFNSRLIELVERWEIDPNLLPPLIK